MSLPPVLFIHGMWADGGHWNRFRRCFHHFGYKTHAVTLLAHDAPQDRSALRRVGIMDYVAQVQDEAASLARAPVVVAHSMGALVAQKLAETVSLGCLVLIGPVAPRGICAVTPSSAKCMSGNLVDALLRRPFRISAGNTRYGILKTLSQREQTVVYQSFLWESGAALWEILTGAVGVDATKVKCPVLIAVGSEDRATPPAVARRIATKYRAEYREYPGQCHFLGASRAVMDDVVQWVLGQVQR